MKPSDAFGVLVRAMGFGSLFFGVMGFAQIVLVLAGLPQIYPLSTVVQSAALYTAFGLGVLIGAPQIVRLVYDRDNSN